MPADSGQQFLSFQPRHQPKEAALLPLHLRGPELCPELGMASPEHSRTSLPLALKESQAFKLKSVHRFMLHTHTHTHTHTHIPPGFLSLHSSFTRAAGTGSLGIGASLTADSTSDPSQIASSASTEILSSLRHKPGPADAGQSSEASQCKGTTREHKGPGLGTGYWQSGHFTCCLGARDELWTCQSWAGLILHQKGQASRSKEACGY